MPKLNNEKNALKGKTGIRRMINAAGYSAAGFKAAFIHESAFREELIAAILMIGGSFFLEVAGIGRALMIMSILLVLIVELINSAIEAIVDRVSLELHPLSKRAKDIGSAAVSVALINVLVVWGFVLFG